MRRLAPDSSIAVVSLAAEAASDGNQALATSPPGGILHAVKEVSGPDTDPTKYYGFVEPYVMQPAPSQTGTFPRPIPAPSGFFDGVRRRRSQLGAARHCAGAGRNL